MGLSFHRMFGTGLIASVALLSVSAAEAAPYTLTVLPDLGGGGDFSYANGINDAGQVVGYSSATTLPHAFLWDSILGMVDLNTLIDPSTFVMLEARAISGNGMIAGFGRDTLTNVNRGFLLTLNAPPPPEGVAAPGALALLGLGLFGIGGLRRKKAA